jgi:YfiH family protein
LNVGAASLPEVTAPFNWRAAGELVWLEAALGSVRAAFTTRLGGVSDGAYRSLNLGVLTDDDRGRVLENRRLLAGALGRDLRSVVMGRQVHGTHVQVRETAPELGTPLAQADAQATHAADLTPLVLVADCVPVVIGRPGVVAALHCGWRGVAGGIVEETLAAMDGAAPRDLHAALGPGIGACCYEVGDEVRHAFRSRGHDDDVMPSGHLDLALAVRRELERHGVTGDRIHSCATCTSCAAELFFSHRRDRGVTGRQAGLAWLSS